MTNSNIDITFFDIPATGNYLVQCANSPFTWAVRLTLNYKNLPYTTVWATHDQVESVCKANDIPLAEGASTYTFPCLIDRTDPSNVVRLMDSHVIVEYLDKAYPEQPVYPNDERTREVEKHGLTKLVSPMSLLVVRHFISDASPNVVKHFERVAPERWGMSLGDVMDAAGPIGSLKREGYWEQVKEGFEGFGLKEGHRWLDGADEPGYKDFVVVGYMMLIYASVQEGGWDRVTEWSNGKWKRYWEAAEEYMGTA